MRELPDKFPFSENLAVQSLNLLVISQNGIEDWY
jgi:hypothetical protein